MLKKTDRICLSCKNSFTPTKSNQKYCSRKCFKKEYYAKKKEEERNQVSKYCCQHCNFIMVLDFIPLEEPDKLKTIVCPNCGKGRETPTR